MDRTEALEVFLRLLESCLPGLSARIEPAPGHAATVRNPQFPLEDSGVLADRAATR